MLKKGSFILILLSLLLLIGCSENALYKVELSLTNIEEQTIYAIFESQEAREVDTLQYEKLSKPLTLTKQEGDFRTVTIYFANQKEWITIYLEPRTKITLTGDAHYPQLLQIRGGTINEDLTNFRKGVAPLLKKQADIVKTLAKSTEGEVSKKKPLTQLANIQLELRLKAESYIKEHPDKNASAILIANYFIEGEDGEKIKQLLSLLTPENSNFYIVKELEQYAEKIQSTTIGAKAINFELTTIKQQKICLDSLRKNELILAFTSTWDDQSHTEQLLLDKITSKDAKQPITVVLVSLDEHAQTIRDSLKKKQTTWHIVTDSTGQAIELINRYNITRLPQAFLIDKEGIIRLKTENGNELLQALEQRRRKEEGETNPTP